MSRMLALPVRVLDGHSDIIHRIAWSPDGALLASPARDATVRIWHAMTGKPVATLSTEKAWGNSAAWSPKRDFLACGTEDGQVYLWSTRDWSLVIKFRAHRSRIECIAWHPQSDLLATAGADGSVGIWQLPNGHLIGRLSSHQNWVNAVAWSHDGERLASGAEDNTVRIWQADTALEIALLAGFTDWVTDVGWSRDDSLVYAASGTDIHVFDAKTGSRRHVLRGHAGRTKCLSVSSDGAFLASKGEDQSVRIWRTSDWTQAWSIEEPTTIEVNPESGIAFHPTLPILATLGGKDRLIRLWDTDRLADEYRQPISDLRPYQSAKVIIVGASGAGKTCIARALSNLSFEPQESTHGMKVWKFDQISTANDVGNVSSREIYLWDLAGQTDYQIVHQLFLDAATIAVIVFDPTEPIESLARVQHWAAAVKQAAPNCRLILVAGRTDRGAMPVATEEFMRPLASYGQSEFFKTSARTGVGIEELRTKIVESIIWNNLPTTHSPAVWEQIKDFVLHQRQSGHVLARAADLRISFRLAYPSYELSVESFDSVVANLQAQGLVWRFSFGDLLLLQPELMNDYASSIVIAARNHPLGLGAIPERDVLDGKIDFSSVPRVDGRENERSIIHAVVQLLLERQLALREGTYLVFPSKFSVAVPTSAKKETTDDVEYSFEGFAEQIYASLVVRLSYSGAFALHSCFANTAVFGDVVDRPCSIRIEYGAERHRLTVGFSQQVSAESRLVFSRFVNDHLETKCASTSLGRRRIYRCDQCGMAINNDDAIAARIKVGKSTIVCQFCDHQVAIVNDSDARFSSAEATERVVQLERVGALATERVVGLTTANAKNDIEQYDVFLAYSGADVEAVEIVAEELRRRRINPWFAKWCIPPGRMFQKEIQKVFFSIPSVAVFVGASGIGPWEDLEIQAAIQSFVKRSSPVIPVLLPGVAPNAGLPMFLSEFTRIELREELAHSEGMDLLEWGITGVKPSRRRGLVAAA